MLVVRKKITSLVAREETRKIKVAGWSLLDKKRNLARIISAEIHKVSVVRGIARESLKSPGWLRTNWCRLGGILVIERKVNKNSERVITVQALFVLVIEMRGIKIMGIISFSIF